MTKYLTEVLLILKQSICKPQTIITCFVPNVIYNILPLLEFCVVVQRVTRCLVMELNLLFKEMSERYRTKAAQSREWMLLAVNSGQVKKNYNPFQPSLKFWFALRTLHPLPDPTTRTKPLSASGPADPTVANVYTKKGRIEWENTHSHFYAELLNNIVEWNAPVAVPAVELNIWKV